MLNFFRSVTGRRGKAARRAARAVRLAVEPLEGRDLPAPLAPTGLAAAGTAATAISLSWNASASPGVTG